MDVKSFYVLANENKTDKKYKVFKTDGYEKDGKVYCNGAVFNLNIDAFYKRCDAVDTAKLFNKIW